MKPHLPNDPISFFIFIKPRHIDTPILQVPVGVVKRKCKKIALYETFFEKCAFIKARAHLETLNEPEKVLNWMFRIANQLVAGWHRDNQRRIRMQSLADVSATEMEVGEAIVHQTAEEHALDEEQKAAAFEAIAQLPELTQKMLQLQLAGKRYEEIAQILEVSVSSVRNRLSRAKKKLNAWGTTWEEANVEGRDVDFSEFNEGEGK